MKKESPYESANFCSKLFYCYINPLIKLANQRAKIKSSLKGNDD